jgi:hypothetical protein
MIEICLVFWLGMKVKPGFVYFSAYAASVIQVLAESDVKNDIFSLLPVPLDAFCRGEPKCTRSGETQTSKWQKAKVSPSMYRQLR